jgi:ATP-dependent helicase/nuclease subunit A
LSKLHIYRASAGSGKTFTISREYIGLLFEDPEKFRHTLAVTFTNKATAEMKGRIIRELFKLATDQNSSYLEFLMQRTRISEDLVRRKASYILKLLLHNYSHFTITTIDSFFQKVIRAFARELGLFSGFEIELDTKTVLNEAVEMLFRKTATDEKLRHWLVRFAEIKIEDARSWDLKNDILRLGNEIHKEIFKQIESSYFSDILNRDSLEAIIPELKKFSEEFEKQLKTLACQAAPILQKYGLDTNDFNRKATGFISIFDKMANRKFYDVTKTMREAIDCPENWYANSSTRKTDIESAFYDGMNDLLKELIEYRDAHILTYNTVSMVFKNLYVLGIIADLIHEINSYATDRNLFLLADSTAFLHKIIEGSDAPFVYEKTGSRVHHFMIDEFQDTSGLQWENFRPLLENSLAGNYRNWIVGDIKQSIYRWRNSDWTILSDKVFQQFPAEQLSAHPLDYNWRSTENVITFNNAFFSSLRDKLQDELNHLITEDELVGPRLAGYTGFFLKAYNDCVQNVPPDKKDGNGYVCMHFLEKEDWENQALIKLIETIEHMQDLGYHLSDMAILIRDKKRGVEISNFMMKEKSSRPGNYRYDIISSDSLFLKNAPVVQWIIALLQLLQDQDDMLTKTFLLREYRDYLILNSSKSELLEEILEQFLSENTQYQILPIYELVDAIIVKFELGTDIYNIPYLQALQDAILQYGKKNAVDVASFLDWWKEFSYKQVISMPENQDAIRLMTIHSSKGLEFKIIIIPFGDWDFTSKSNESFIWATPHEAPFEQLKLLPIQLNNSAANSIFNFEYFREQIYSKIDNLNLLYVAFTRAIDKLYVFTPIDTHKEETKNTGQLLNLYRCEIENQPQLNKGLLRIKQEDNSALVEYGNLEPMQEKTLSNDSGFEINNYYISSLAQRKARMVVSGEFQNEGSLDMDQRTQGNLFHKIFQYIGTIDDIENAIHEMIKNGLIRASEEFPMIQKIKELINIDKVKTWFEDGWQVKMEADILLKSARLKRPDRIMFGKDTVIVVDYKFGEKQEDSYKYQVRDYKLQLQQMGYKNVETYIWYVFLKKVVVVENTPQQGMLL